MTRDAPTSWPYSTADKPGVPGIYKQRWEDFRVEELPTTEPSGSGEHAWLLDPSAGPAEVAGALRTLARDPLRSTRIGAAAHAHRMDRGGAW